VDTHENDSAADPNSLASPSQAAAASNIGAEPAPENIRSELTSGGNTKKLISLASFESQQNVPGGSAHHTEPVGHDIRLSTGGYTMKYVAKQ
jgi:hypothetical protein